MIYLELYGPGDEEDDVDGDNGGDDGDEWLVPGPVVPGQVATLQLTATKPPHHLVRRLVHQTILVHIYSFFKPQHREYISSPLFTNRHATAAQLKLHKNWNFWGAEDIPVSPFQSLPWRKWLQRTEVFSPPVNLEVNTLLKNT